VLRRTTHLEWSPPVRGCSPGHGTHGTPSERHIVVANIYGVTRWSVEGKGDVVRRLILMAAMGAALSVPASVASLFASTPVGAASGVSCTKLYGYASGSYKFDLRKCTPPMAEKALTGFGTQLTRVGGPTTYTWTWNGGGTTTVSLSVVQAGTCPAGYTAYTDTGTVTGGTSTYTQPGDAIQMSVCRRIAAKYMGGLRLAAGSSSSL